MRSIYKQKHSANYWIKYYRSGRVFRESSGSPKESVAKRLLRLREGDIERGVPITPRVGRLRFDEAAADLVTDYKVNGKRSLVVVERRLRKHLEPVFGGRRMAGITTTDVRAYVAHRQATPIEFKPLRQGDPPRRRQVSNAEINRELTILKRAFSLAIQAGKLINKPYIPLLKERNVRTGFFERHQFDRRLSAPVRGPDPDADGRLHHGLAHPERDPDARMAPGGLRRRRTSARSGHDQERRWPGVPDDHRTPGRPRTTVAGHAGAGQDERPHLPVGLSPQKRQARQELHQDLADRISQGGLSRTYSARLSSHGGTKSCPRGRARARRHAADRTQDALGV